jgi:predicted nucleic acid-binding protein
MILTPDNEYSAVLDACVLYPMPLCDTLLRLAEEPAFYRPFWSEQILQEVGETLTRHNYTEDQRNRRINVMREHFPEAIVDVPEEIIKAVSTLPDMKDCHVLAAAILSKANAIVTTNTKHFPAKSLEKYGVLCQSADEFLIHQYYLWPEGVLEKLDEQAADIKLERACLLELLAKATPRFVKLLQTGKPD